MAYRNIYKDLFMDLEAKIPEYIENQFIYPEFIYNIQAEMLEKYHNIKPEVLFRNDDLWEIAKYSTVKANLVGDQINPNYTVINNEGEIGLVIPYTKYGKQNIIAYLVGTNGKLELHRFSNDSNVLGPMQLGKEIEQDEIISREINSLNVTGTKITKTMLTIPIENTILYVEPIYQTSLNESQVPVLKKVVVAIGNKVAIGDNLEEAVEKLFSQDAVDIEIENTDDEKGLIDAIIKANANLEKSIKNNDWEMIGKDMTKLQELIKTLEMLKEKEKEKEKDNKLENKIENIIVD